MTPIRLTLALTGLCALTACDPGPPPDDVRASQALTRTAPPGAAPGTCWSKIVTPAVVETVTAQILATPEQPGADGTIQPATYRTETRQVIVQNRSERWFETPCPEQMTPEFIASLQRSLTVRGHYSGPVNGIMDSATRTAVHQYQVRNGLDSGILSLKTARALGLVAVTREE